MSDNAALLTLQQRQLHDRRAAALVNNNGRDPRAVPVSVSRNISSPESCEFYGIADAISGCRVPRSCQDCLAMPGCGINGVGYCVNATSNPENFKSEYDYRNATFEASSPNVSEKSYYNFVSGTATYCTASDPGCTSCRNYFQHLASAGIDRSSRSTQFCRGDDGCVCIRACELPAERLPYVLDNECGQPIIYNRQFPKSSRRSQIVARSEPRAPVAVMNHTSPKDESCAYTKDADLRGCRRPRTCRDCLQRQGCMISGFKCADMTGYDWHYDFRRKTFDVVNHSRVDPAGISTQIPSTNATYCSASDAACTSCQSLPVIKDNWGAMSANSLICTGKDGCVCVEACENELWNSGVYDSECLQLDKLSIEPPHPISSLVIAAFVWIVLLVAYKQSTYKPPTTGQDGRHTQANRGILRHMLDEVPGLARLDLFGWRAYREELMLREQELLHGLDVTRPLGNPVDFECLGPSAPDFDEDDASAPTAHDPKALASAPVYRSSFNDSTSASDDSSYSTQDTSHSSPSAPDFDDEETQWEFEEISHGEQQQGVVSRRPRLGDVDA